VSRRTYRQFCPVAAALDAVGERWTLLIVRELLLGPRRFSDLQAALPGLGVSLLAQRLQQMSAAGLVSSGRQPVGGVAYQLTEAGAALGPVVRALAQWGLRQLADRPPDGPVRVDLLALYLAASAPAVDRPREVYELRVAGAAAHLRTAVGKVRAYRGAPPDPPDLIAELDQAALVDLCLGRASLTALAADGRARLTGGPDVVARASRLLDHT
jgi:DNA-binding HxlR family transcriptional regulator